MPERYFARVKPEMFRWARETAGYPLPVAAAKIGVRPEKLAAVEEGNAEVTVRQLREVARVYRRPLAAFYLPAPPPVPAPVHDFRRILDAESGVPSPELQLELRRARRRRSVALDLFADLGSAPPSFPLSADRRGSVDAAAAAARDWLGIRAADQADWRGEYEALNAWIAALEARFVLVFQTGDVELSEMRGFSLSEDQLPVIVLNGKDAPRARVFTLAHEFAHLMLRAGGVCDPTRMVGRTSRPDEQIEIFCNRVAGAVLVPTPSLMAAPEVASSQAQREWAEGEIRSLADRFAVSREVVVLRLAAIGRATEAFVGTRLDAYRREYAERAARVAPGGFPPLYRLVVRNNGRRYTRLVLEALEKERISLADVSDYLGVRLKHLDKIADAVQQRGGDGE